MSCENLVPISLFNAEIDKLKKEIAALKTAGLNQKQVQEAKKLSLDPKLLGLALGSYIAGGGEIPSLGRLINSEVRLQSKVVENNLSYKMGKWGEYIYDVENQVKTVAKETRSVKTIAVTARNEIKATNGLLTALRTKLNSVSNTVTGLGSKVAKFGETVIENSRFLSGLRAEFQALMKRLAPFLAKLAPFLKLLDLLLTGLSIFELIQLTRRMTNAERGILALQTALTFAGGKLLTAAYVGDLERRLAGQTAVNAQQFNALTTQINNQHNLTRNSINGTIQSESYATRQAINANVTQQHIITRNAVNTNVNSQNIATRQAINTNVTEQHIITRNTVNTNVNGQHIITRRAIGTQTQQGLDNSQAVREIQAHRAEFREFNNRLNQRFNEYIVSPINRQVSGFQAQFTAFNNGLNQRFNQHIVSPIIGWQSTHITPRLNYIQNSVTSTYNKAQEIYDKVIEKFNKTWDYLKMDRVLNVLTTASVIHNAAMLSTNLGASLLDTIGETAAIIGFKDAEGNAYDLSAILGRSAQSLIVSVIGQDAFNNLSIKWRNANRIISAGAGVVMALRSMQWAIAEGIETIGTWIARIGNGLEDDGVVTDRKWAWMDENRVQVNRFAGLEKITSGLETAEEITENVYMAVSSGQEIAESVTQARQATANFNAVLEQQKTAEDNAAAARISTSQSPTPTIPDISQYEPDPEVP